MWVPTSAVCYRCWSTLAKHYNMFLLNGKYSIRWGFLSWFGQYPDFFLPGSKCLFSVDVCCVSSTWFLRALVEFILVKNFIIVYCCIQNTIFVPLFLNTPKIWPLLLLFTLSICSSVIWFSAFLNTLHPTYMTYLPDFLTWPTALAY